MPKERSRSSSLSKKKSLSSRRNKSLLLNNNLATKTQEVSLRQILLTTRKRQSSNDNDNVTVIEYMKPVIKQNIIYSDRTKLQAKLIERLVLEQERETAERKRNFSQEQLSDSSETFDRTMVFIEEQIRNEEHNLLI